MTKQENFFYSLFDNNPGIAILHINNNCDDISLLLENIVTQNKGSLKTKQFDTIDQKRFRLTAREYEYTVVSNCLHKVENIDRFISQLYHSLENSANIILLSKKENLDPYGMIEILDRNDFRAANQIDIFDDYYLVTAKKMHMWGNGL